MKATLKLEGVGGKPQSQLAHYIGTERGRVEGHPTLEPAALSNPEQLRFKANEW